MAKRISETERQLRRELSKIGADRLKMAKIAVSEKSVAFNYQISKAGAPTYGGIVLCAALPSSDEAAVALFGQWAAAIKLFEDTIFFKPAALATEPS